MNKIKVSIIVLVIVGIILCYLWIGYNFAPGSYPYVETYEINVNDSTLITAIRKFKSDNPQYNVPTQTQLKDGPRDSNDHWYHIYFYYMKENQIVKTWVRQTDMNKTTFAFVGVNNGLILGNWKFINKDFSRSENKEQKKKFEERILNKLEYK